MDPCMLCGGELKQRDSLDALDMVYCIECPRCGVYRITDETALALQDPYVKERLHLISAVARWKSERGQCLSVNGALLEDRSEFEARIFSLCPRNTQEKMDGILRYVEEKSYPGDKVTIHMRNDYPLFYCKNAKEMRFYLENLQGLITDLGTTGDYKEILLSAKGWRRVEELAKPNIESKQVFVAMWFDDELKSVYSDGIAKLEEDTGFSMLRIDMSQFNEKICDRIISEIRKSRFLIADVTKHRQGVYFEAGFAMGLGLTVIWTCREDEIEQCHFDTRQYNHIVWTNAAELRERLKDRILATIGEAP